MLTELTFTIDASIGISPSRIVTADSKVSSSSVDMSPLSFDLQDDNSDCVQPVFSGHDCLHLHSGPQHPSGLLHRWNPGV